MFVIKDLRINRFKDVAIPRRRELYERLGGSVAVYPSSTNDPQKFSFPVNRQDMMNNTEVLQTGYDVQMALNKIKDSKTVDNQTVTLPVNDVTDTHPVQKPQDPKDL